MAQMAATPPVVKRGAMARRAVILAVATAVIPAAARVPRVAAVATPGLGRGDRRGCKLAFSCICLIIWNSVELLPACAPREYNVNP